MFRHVDRPTIAPLVRSAFLFALASALLFCSLRARRTFAAPQTVVRDPQALTLIASSLKALTGQVGVNDVTLQATASYVAGSDEESGTATLTASGNQQSLVQINLSGGSRQEIRNGPAGAWSGPDATAHSMALHNCWTDANWFFPTLTLQAVQTDATLGVLYLGLAVWNSVATLHLQFFHIIPGQTPDITAEIQNLSTIDLYLDPKSLLPLALDFNTHLDDDLLANIPVEIQFGNYQNAGGILVPFRVQRFLQSTLNLDLTLVQAAVNTGVSPSTFTLPQLPAGGAQ
jgi:hypothetical protein